jgi:hypothetical protein
MAASSGTHEARIPSPEAKMKLFDCLLRSGFEPALATPDHVLSQLRPLARKWTTELAKAMPVVVSMDNVADYYWENPKDDWRIEKGDFPCLAPPWPLTFLEYRAPARIVTRKGTELFPKELGERFGILLDSATFGCEEMAFRGLPDCPFLPGHSSREAIDHLIEGCQWVQQASVFAETHKEILLLGTFCWFLNHQGAFHFPVKEIGGAPFLPPFAAHLEEETLRRLGHDCWAFLSPALLAISFIHCRNTKLIDHAPSLALRKATERRHGIRPVTFKTLEIEPVKKILAEQGNVQQSGLRMALHICRGHFKDYRSSGLFGKQKGLYWWDQHVRGHLEEGLVIKNYEIPKALLPEER